MRSIASWVAAFLLVCAGAASAQSYYDAPPPPPPPPPGYGQTVTCASQGYRMQRCYAPRGWRDARIVRQTSNSACVRDRTWGFDRSGLWVDQGCAAVFAEGGYGGGYNGGYNGGYDGGWQPDPGWNQRFTVSCGSPQYHYYFCQVDVGRHGRVYMRRQLSNAACREGSTWGWNRAGVWVDRGCSAEFVVDRRW